MSLKYLDKSKIQNYLTAFWKRELGTTADPANGKHYETGANNQSLGLYGSLNDSVVQHLDFDDSKAQFDKGFVVQDAKIIDNRNGLTPRASVSLQTTETNTTSNTHSTTDSIKTGIALEYKAEASLFGIGGEATSKFSFEYSHSWTKSHTELETRSTSSTVSTNVEVPRGRVYKVATVSRTNRLTVPYRANILVDGYTDTWFEHRVSNNGPDHLGMSGKHYWWRLPIRFAFQRIHDWGLAGSDSHSFGVDPKTGKAALTQTGNITNAVQSNAVIQTYDITENYDPDAPVQLSRRLETGGPSLEGLMLSEHPVVA